MPGSVVKVDPDNELEVVDSDAMKASNVVAELVVPSVVSVSVVLVAASVIVADISEMDKRIISVDSVGAVPSVGVLELPESVTSEVVSEDVVDSGIKLISEELVNLDALVKPDNAVEMEEVATAVDSDDAVDSEVVA